MGVTALTLSASLVPAQASAETTLFTPQVSTAHDAAPAHTWDSGTSAASISHSHALEQKNVPSQSSTLQPGTSTPAPRAPSSSPGTSVSPQNSAKPQVSPQESGCQPTNRYGADKESSGQEVAIDITSVSPDSGSPKDPITIRGTVTNISGKNLRWVQVSFWRSLDPISGYDDMGSVLQSPPEIPTGARWFREPNEASINNITDPESTQTFANGQCATFTVTATPEKMGLTDTSKAYLIGVHAQATPEHGSRHTVGRARTFTVLTDSHTSAWSSSLVVLNSTPSTRIDGTFIDDHLADELDGRLLELVNQAIASRRTVLVDPELLDEVTAMTKGYQVAQGDKSAPGKGGKAAKAWLDRFTTMLKAVPAYRLPYGSADVTGVAATTSHRDVLTQIKESLPPDNPAAKLPLAVLDEAGELTKPALTMLTSTLHPALVVTSALPTALGPRTSNDTTVIPLATDALEGGPPPSPSMPAQIRGRALAQTLLTGTQNSPLVTAAHSPDQVRSVTPPAWMHQVDLRSIRPTRSQLPALNTRDSARLLGLDWASQLERTADEAQAWTKLLSDPGKVSQPLGRISVSGLSTKMSASERRLWWHAAMAPARRYLSGEHIELHSASSFVMSSSSNEFPLAVTNHLDQAIDVKAVIVSENPQRIDIPNTKVITVRPGETQALKFSPHASSNGQVRMTATLTSRDGRPIGQPETFVVKATQMDDIGWVIIVVSGGIVIAATVLRIRQVRKRGTGRNDSNPAASGAAHKS